MQQQRHRRTRQRRAANGRPTRRPAYDYNRIAAFVSIVLVAIIAVVGSVIFVRKYAPTKETLPLDEYYTYFNEDDAALLVDDAYEEMDENDTAGDAIVIDGELYFEWTVLKYRIDNRYVFDNTEEVMRYVTDTQVISVPYGGRSYAVDKEFLEHDAAIVVAKYNTYYVSASFVQHYSDFAYTVYDDPYRAVVYTAGYARDVAPIKGKSAIRRLGGPKSKILKTGEKNESVTVLDTVGKWTQVATEDGVIGYVRSARLGASEETVQEATLPERNYTHLTVDGRINLGWHQVTNRAANAGLSNVLANTSGLTVVSPTWYYMDDNDGGIADFSDSDYIQTAHAKGLQVWGLVSNFENNDVDSTSILNRTSSRDALVNNLIGSAIAVGLDGINVDFEGLSVNAADGYIEFIRELSLKCKKNDLILSVDNYVPSSSSAFYNRREQANYADYIIVMAYDEHTRSDTDPGSTASKPFVESGVKATLDEVPAEQVILGMPFYTRAWALTSDGTLTSEVLQMVDSDDYLARHGMMADWNEELGQNYAEGTEDGTTYMVWVEDAKSLAIKLSMVQEYKLAGGAFWKLSFEPEAIWTVIGNYLN